MDVPVLLGDAGAVRRAHGFAPLWTPVRAEPLSIASSLASGLVSNAAYGIVIWALQSGAIGAVSALRETSVVFAVLIGRLFLREACPQAVSPEIREGAGGQKMTAGISGTQSAIDS